MYTRVCVSVYTSYREHTVRTHSVEMYTGVCVSVYTSYTHTLSHTHTNVYVYVLKKNKKDILRTLQGGTLGRPLSRNKI